MAAHILPDGTVQYAPGTMEWYAPGTTDRDTAIAHARMLITSTSPFILLAITEVGAGDENTGQTGGTAAFEVWAVVLIVICVGAAAVLTVLYVKRRKNKAN